MSTETTPSKWDDLLVWLETNLTAVLIAAGVVILSIFGFYVYQWRSEQAEVAASERLLELRPVRPTQASEETPPAPASAFLKLAEEYAGTGAAERAQLLAAGALFTEERYGEARAEFERFLQRSGGSPFASTAAHGVAAALEAEGRQEEAFQAYALVVQRYPASPVADDARLNLARIHEARNQPEAAFKIYEELTSPDAPSIRMGDVLRRKEHLLLRFPELARAVAPSAEMEVGEPSAVWNQ